MIAADEERLHEVTAALLGAVRDIREYIVGPPASDEEVRSWPLWVDEGRVWCADEDCPLMAENAQIGDFWDRDFTLAELHKAIGEHIATRREREADEVPEVPTDV